MEKYIYKLKFERIRVDDNGNLFPIDDKPTLQSQVMVAQPEIQIMNDGNFDLDKDIFEKLVKEIRHKI